jgi:hypothetical protein
MLDGNGVYSDWFVNGFRFILTEIGGTAPSDETWGDTTPLFEWNEPYFPEPDQVPDTMTYQLQVATDQNFTNIIRDIDGIEETQYQSISPFSITTTESHPYYWRVRYYDQNNIYSEWSRPIFFFISP